MIEEEEADANGWARLVLINDDGDGEAAWIHVRDVKTSMFPALQAHIDLNFTFSADDLAALGRTFTRLSEQARAKEVEWL